MITSNIYNKFGCKQTQLRLVYFQVLLNTIILCILITPSLLVASCHSENTPLGEHKPQGSSIVLVHNTFYFCDV